MASSVASPRSREVSPSTRANSPSSSTMWPQTRYRGSSVSSAGLVKLGAEAVEVELPLRPPDGPGDVEDVLVGDHRVLDPVGERGAPGLVGRPVVPDDPIAVAEVDGAEDAGPVEAAEPGVATGLELLTVLAHLDVGDPLAEVEVDVAVGALEVAVVLEREPLGDQQGAVGSEPQRHLGAGDVGAARERRPGEGQGRGDRRDDGTDQAPEHHPGPGERLTRGVASAPAGASKNSRRSNPNRRATITAGKIWIRVL